MAKLRRNHANQSKQSGGMITKVGIFGAIVAGLYALFNFFSGGEGPTIAWEDEGEPSVYAGELHFLPSEVSGSASVSESGSCIKKPLVLSAVTTPEVITGAPSKGETSPLPCTSLIFANTGGGGQSFAAPGVGLRCR